MEKETALIEAILYLETEPVDENVLARNSGLSREVVDQVLEILRERYADETHGVEIVQISGGWTISPK